MWHKDYSTEERDCFWTSGFSLTVLKSKNFDKCATDYRACNKSEYCASDNKFDPARSLVLSKESAQLSASFFNFFESRRTLVFPLRSSNTFNDITFDGIKAFAGIFQQFAE